MGTKSETRSEPRAVATGFICRKKDFATFVHFAATLFGIELEAA